MTHANPSPPRLVSMKRGGLPAARDNALAMLALAAEMHPHVPAGAEGCLKRIEFHLIRLLHKLDDARAVALFLPAVLHK